MSDKTQDNSPFKKPTVAVTGASRGSDMPSSRSSTIRAGRCSRWPARRSRTCALAEGIVQHIEVDLADPVSIRASMAELKKRLGARG